ncbi:unnamed protein product [Bursaphelenchus xylophilus]|uniref:(pine wood nematode) hypothetical protein n=1 Tax=Bursaphelenchus xylophilus TaxID=6326 RepID=A0A1I7S192_BURXY|nr:unnamed protein product [Bursaphelenchus xylophilus]CAG9080134.1 unnamed protein product [Bursaphelenchus xylophilus]
MLFACFGKKRKKKIESEKTPTVSVIYGNETYIPSQSPGTASSSVQPIHVSIPLEINHNTNASGIPLANLADFESDNETTSQTSSEKKSSVKTSEEFEIIEIDENSNESAKFRKLEDVDANKLPRPFSQYEKFTVIKHKPNFSLLFRNCISLPTYLDQIVVKPRQSLRPMDVIVTHPTDPMPTKRRRNTRIPKRMSKSVHSHGDYEKLRRNILGRKYLLTKTADGNEWVRVGGGFESSDAFERRKSRLTMGRKKYGTSPDIFQYKIITIKKK